jgi:hypothetical protein
MHLAYAIVVSVPIEKTQYAYMSYITTYPPSGTHTFNAAWTALHTLQEHIHALRKSPAVTPTLKQGCLVLTMILISCRHQSIDA